MKPFIIISFLLTVFIFAFVTSAEAQIPSQKSSSEQSNEVDNLIARFNKPEHINLLQGILWTVTHDYEDFKQMQEVLTTFQGYFEAIEKHKMGETASLKKLGGVKAFKDKLAEWLNDDDQAIRTFAATILGIIGDKAYAPKIANLLKERNYKEKDSIFYDRGRAAMSLGMMGAKEYLPEIVPLLKSKNEYDRAGAIQALEYFGAKEFSKEIAGLLTNKDFQFDDDPSPIFFLVEMGTAQEYQKELVQVMLSEFNKEKSEAAMFALVKLNAKEHTKDIAKLLAKEFRKEAAVKALALLGANEYADKIALMLNDKDSSVQAAAALALGILKSRKYADNVAEFLKNKESLVAIDAATAILLMEAEEYYKGALPYIERPLSELRYLIETDFHPLVMERARQLTEELKKSFEKAKGLTANQK